MELRAHRQCPNHQKAPGDLCTPWISLPGDLHARRTHGDLAWFTIPLWMKFARFARNSPPDSTSTFARSWRMPKSGKQPPHRASCPFRGLSRRSIRPEPPHRFTKLHWLLKRPRRLSFDRSPAPRLERKLKKQKNRVYSTGFGEKVTQVVNEVLCLGPLPGAPGDPTDRLPQRDGTSLAFRHLASFIFRAEAVPTSSTGSTDPAWSPAPSLYHKQSCDFRITKANGETSESRDFPSRLANPFFRKNVNI